MITREELKLSELDIENRKKDEKKVTQALFDIGQFLKKMRPMGYIFTQEELDEQDEAVVAFQIVKQFIENKINKI